MGMKLGMTTETFSGNENQSWLGSAHGTQECDSITIDGAQAATDFPGGVMPSGVVLGRVTATGRYRRYASGNGDGSQTPVGFLFTTVDLNASGRTAGADVSAALLWHGEVVVANLPAGHGLDAGAQTALASKFRFV